MNRVLSALPLDIYFAGAAQQKYQFCLEFVPMFRVELLLRSANPRMHLQKQQRARPPKLGAPAPLFPSAFRRSPT
jgi:hypothetical protein